jgi:F420-dependent oxidoreductase-like protein
MCAGRERQLGRRAMRATMPPSMDLCLMIEGQEGVSWEDWLALARACEAHGVPGLFRSDHYLNLGGQPDRGSLDAWATLSALAAVTSSLRLGTLVSPATFRHPSELAKVVATVDWVSGGRVELGLGAGWHEPEHRAYGFEFPPVRERMDRLEEQLEIVHRSWTEGPFSFSGRHYSLSGLDAQPRPVQSPHPPLIVGGSGRRRGVALAARWADEYNTPFASLSELGGIRARLDEACAAVDRPPIPLSLMTGFLCGLDAGELGEKAAALAFAQGESARDIDAWLAAPPAGWIVGTVDECAEQLRALRELGLSRVMLQHLLHTDLETVELIGRKLAPAVA